MLKQDSDARVADAETALNRIIDEACAAAGVSTDAEHFENVSLRDLRAFENYQSTQPTESFGVCAQVQAVPNAFAALADCIMQLARRDVSNLEELACGSGLRGGRMKGAAFAIGNEWLVQDLLREVMHPLSFVVPSDDDNAATTGSFLQTSNNLSGLNRCPRTHANTLESFEIMHRSTCVTYHLNLCIAAYALLALTVPLLPPRAIQPRLLLLASASHVPLFPLQATLASCFAPHCVRIASFLKYCRASSPQRP